jgi:hypothetical protein
VGARIENDRLFVDLADGRIVSAPLTWFPKLFVAGEAKRANWRVAHGGCGLRWPDIDEYISIDAPLRGAPSSGDELERL